MLNCSPHVALEGGRTEVHHKQRLICEQIGIKWVQTTRRVKVTAGLGDQYHPFLGLPRSPRGARVFQLPQESVPGVPSPQLMKMMGKEPPGIFQVGIAIDRREVHY